jgi:hypothetical protein
MSKLRDRIRDIARRRPAAIGFATTRTSETRSRQLLVIAEADDAATTSRAAAAGADAIIFTGALDRLPDSIANAGKAVVGARVDAATAQDAAALSAAGGDFLVCTDEHAEAAAMLDQKLGYVLIAPVPIAPALQTPSTDDDALRLLRPLDLDGLILPALPERMTVRQQLHARRLSELARKPLFVRVEGPVAATALELWRDAGVVAVVTNADNVASLVEAADAVPPPRQPRERPDAVVPSVRPGSFDDEEEEER